MPSISKTDIRRAVGGGSYGRGRRYFEDDKVISVRRGRGGGNVVCGEVKGRYKKSYEQQIDLFFTPHGQLERVAGSCSCPVGFNCKHVAAALLAARQEWFRPGRTTKSKSADKTVSQGSQGSQGIRHEKGDPASRRTPVPPPLRRWLDNVDLSIADGKARRSALPRSMAQASVNRMCYVFERDREGFARIRLFRAYIKKDGSVGGTVKEYAPDRVYPLMEGVTAADSALIARLSRYNIYSRHGHYYVDDPREPLPIGFGNGDVSLPCWPHGDDLIAFIRDILQTGHAYAGDIKGTALSWTAQRKVVPEWRMDADGAQRLGVRDGDGKQMEILPFPVPLYMDTESGDMGIADMDLPPAALSTLVKAPLIPHTAVGEVARRLKTLKPRLNLPLPEAVTTEHRGHIEPRPVLHLYGAKTYGDLYPCARLYFVYDGAQGRFSPGEGEEEIRLLSGGKRLVISRDFGYENSLNDELMDLGSRYEADPPDTAIVYGGKPRKIREASLVFPPIFSVDHHTFKSLQDYEAFEFAVQALPLLKHRGWEVETDDSWPFRMREGPQSISAGLETETDRDDWYSLAVRADIGGEAVDLTSSVLQFVESLPVDADGELADGVDLKQLASEMNLYVEMADGSFVVVDAAQLSPFIEAFLQTQAALGFHRAEAARVARLAEALEGSGAVWRGGQEILDLGKRLQALSEARQLPAPAGFKGELRPYQQTGYGWLRALADSGFGGTLADDMGLGKTVQALCLLAHRHLKMKTDRPSLLIAPTSLLGNWRREAARFAPGLKLLTLHGPDRREKFHEIPDHHLVLSTYPLVNRDHEPLFAYKYDIAILDEAQAVKNPAAAVSKRIRGIKARQRLALTGTPMENNLGELWTLYDWLIPGLLGDRKQFNREYRRPIEQQGDGARQRLLSARLKPFLLRRNKEEVAKDLPPKTETDEIIPLEGGQAALYESIRTAMDARVREAVAAKGIAGSRITILDALLKMRQVCCDPALVKIDSARKVKESAKRGRLLELLEELMAEGRKVLVFSQFVQMLRLIEKDVTARGWPCAMLHGQTRNRDAVIETFQSGDAALFLISLKAGGVGLNLTAADTIILYDPWWNPAVERQAMDRAHRIGQDKPVFVHRLIAEGTVEAAIQRLQAQKQALADALFEGAGEGPTALTQADLDMLLGASVVE